MNESLELIVMVGFLIGGSIFLVLFCLTAGLRKPKERELTYTTRTVNATVIDQYCGVKTIGHKTPKTIKIFTVVFKTNDECIKLDVPEEMYDGFEKGQTGLLTIVDNDLYSFVPDEELT